MTETKLVILMAVGLISIVGSIVLSQVGDVEVSGILGLTAGLSGISYFSLRGISRGIPRFLSARNSISASIAFMVAGASIFSIGAVQNLMTGSVSGVPLKLAGVIMFVSAGLGFTLALVKQRTTNK